MDETIWDKKKEICKQRIDHSVEGDEIVIVPKNEQGEQLPKKTFICIEPNSFCEANIFVGPDDKKQLKLDVENVTGEMLHKQMTAEKTNEVFWNRGKFTTDEVTHLYHDQVITNYDKINEEYDPKKQIADMQLEIASFLQSVTPRSEVNYYKYKDGKEAGIDTYLCKDKYQFVRLEKKKENGHRIVNAYPDRTFSVWEIVNTLPKNPQELSPLKDIRVRCKWSKYGTKDMAQLLEGKSLDDGLIEKRRMQYLTTNHLYVEKDKDSKTFTEYWVDKKTNEVVNQRDRTLSDEAISKYTKENKIVPKESIVAKEITPKAKKVLGVTAAKNRGLGVER